MKNDPVDLPATDNPRAEKKALAQPLSSELAKPDRPLAHSRVLVVDDNRDAADSLGMLLRFLGAEVLVVHDGPAALAATRSFAPTFVLLDIGMPGMDGVEVARRMREDPAAKHATLVALTGRDQPDDRQAPDEVAFDHYLVKPADAGALEAILSGKPSTGD